MIQSQANCQKAGVGDEPITWAVVIPCECLAGVLAIPVQIQRPGEQQSDASSA